MLDLIKIKPCPFCGGTAASSYNGEWRYVICRTCGSQGQSFSVLKEKGSNIEIQNLAIKAWNMRIKDLE